MSLHDISLYLVAATTTCTDDDGQDDIAVEEIVMNGEPILSNEDYFDPSQLCSIQITGREV